MSASKPITTTDLGGGVARLAFDDPPRKNCVDGAVCAALIEALDALSADPSVKVVVFTGTRAIFCAGGTMETVQKFVAGEIDPIVPLSTRRMAAFPLPIIAALEGSASGGGLTLAMCCDILIAAEEQRYGLNFTSMGFTPGDGSMALAPLMVGYQMASEMLCTGKFYRGRELRGTGLFAHVVPQAEVMPLALDIAGRIAEKPRHVLTLVKEELALPRRRALEEAVLRERLMHQICSARPETRSDIDDRYGSWASAAPRANKE
jgi:polyketide biosynthesis enoyl-CoA hydratase PksI